MTIDELLAEIVANDASDGFITARAAPAIKVDGEIRSLGKQALFEEQARELVLSTMTPAQKEEFDNHQECNYAISHDEYGRFRASAFVQRGQCGRVLRRIKGEIPRMDEIGLPYIVSELAMTKRGLIIFVGGTGTGKSPLW